METASGNIMQFDFGENWREFAQEALTAEKAEQARRDFKDLLGDIEIKNKTFLDIGFGQGLGLLSATGAGAKTVGLDINPKCREALNHSARFFPDVDQQSIPVEIGSILSQSVVEKLKTHAPRGYDTVHSWGVLHHTGDMKKALANAASLLAPGGHLLLAIYNRHWTSPLWRLIKYIYCVLPKALRPLYIRIFYGIIFFAKRVHTGQDPRQKERGMDFFFDVIDWVGGYPYEYATVEELDGMLKEHGLVRIRTKAAAVPTGCNELIYRMSRHV